MYEHLLKHFEVTRCALLPYSFHMVCDVSYVHFVCSYSERRVRCVIHGRGVPHTLQLTMHTGQLRHAKRLPQACGYSSVQPDRARTVQRGPGSGRF